MRDFDFNHRFPSLDSINTSAQDRVMDMRRAAVLGAGALGAAIAARLGESGYDVKLWNRTGIKARAAAMDSPGVTAVDDVADAVKDAAVVFTVLRDGSAVADVMRTVVTDVAPGAVWVQASTIGPRDAQSLSDLARAHGVAYLDAPVSGSTGPARAGKLIWLVSGTEEAVELASPTLVHLGSAVEHLGIGVEGSAIKLAVNAWMTAATVAMSDVLSLSDGLGIDHALLTRVLEDGPLAMPYALQKAAVMDNHVYTPGFAVDLARKDLALATSMVAATPLLQAVEQRLDQTIAAGYGRDDIAAVDYQRQVK
jgi:3-hydroxyisobutyrate dehydrogenase